mgnify:CR=1 FL=1
MKLKLIITTLSLMIVANCGYKVVNQNYLDKYAFTEITINGDNRISYLLRNNLKRVNKEAAKNIKLDLTVNKTKSIKEKNIQNQITKYKIDITADVKYYIIEENKSENFNVSKSGDYVVNKRYSTTLNNEKQLIKSLVNDISEQIFTNLKINLNEL